MAEEDSQHVEEESERYLLGRFLSESRNGAFYEAVDTTTGEEVMVKKITPEKSRGSSKELEILTSLKHPNIIKLKDAYSYKGSLHLVFERMNYSLKQIAQDPGITVSLAHIKSYLKMILEGVSHCHGKLVLHKNLKLKNLFIAHDGTLKLADFCYACIFHERDQIGPLIDITAVRNVFAKLVLSRNRPKLLHGHKFMNQLSFIFRELDRETVELLWKMCQTRDIISAKKALQHRYFSSDPSPTYPGFLSKPVLDLNEDVGALVNKAHAMFKKQLIGETSQEKSKEPEKDQPAGGSWIQMGKRIGKGTFGSVYEGIDTTTTKKIAVKTDLPGWQARRSIKSELKMFQILQKNKFQHENILKCLGGWKNHKNELCIIFELMRTDLSQIISKNYAYLSFSDIKSYVLMMLQGLEYCHSKQIIHRDVKPNNFLIGEDGRLKLADFGDARRFMDYPREYPEEICNRMYRAPELFLGRKAYGPAIDMWSAGCVFAELLQGKLIFPGHTDTDVLEKIFQHLGSDAIPNWTEWLSKYPRFVGTWYEGNPIIIRSIVGSTEYAQELLSRMLEYDPVQRISAKDAIAHRYFQTEPLATDPSELPEPGQDEVLAKAVQDIFAKNSEEEKTELAENETEE